ncbi:MAG: aminopeptidase [Elusimicrobia bacterium]|nr:aminopeptidase [Elusimicrobiota bacterium]
MRALPLLALFLLSGCSPLYAVKSASGHLGFVWRARPVNELLEDPATDPKTRAKLELVDAARRFAFEDMGLRKSKDYAKVSRIKGPYVTYMVMAADQASFRRHEWWFPFIGRVPYKGHFSPKDAKAEAGRLGRKGLDVLVAGISAYNTPLPFADPLAHTQLELPEGELVALVLHELCHGTVFLKGRVDFDESLASFVGEAGALDFLARRFGPEAPESLAFRAGLERDRRYAAEIESLYQELDRLYRSGLPRERVLADRAPILAKGRERLSAVLGRDSGELNNAVILGHRLYRADQELFGELHERLGRSWKVTIEFLRSLDRRRPAEDLRARLERLRPAP